MKYGQKVEDQILRMKRPGGLAEPAGTAEDALPVFGTAFGTARTETVPSASTRSAVRGEKMLVSRAEG
jgi:hypothetical protein